jgi:hypothetical protein
MYVGAKVGMKTKIYCIREETFVRIACSEIEALVTDNLFSAVIMRPFTRLCFSGGLQPLDR